MIKNVTPIRKRWLVRSGLMYVSFFDGSSVVSLSANPYAAQDFHRKADAMAVAKLVNQGSVVKLALVIAHWRLTHAEPPLVQTEF